MPSFLSAISLHIHGPIHIAKVAGWNGTSGRIYHRHLTERNHWLLKWSHCKTEIENLKRLQVRPLRVIMIYCGIYMRFHSRHSRRMHMRTIAKITVSLTYVWPYNHRVANREWTFECLIVMLWNVKPSRSPPSPPPPPSLPVLFKCCLQANKYSQGNVHQPCLYLQEQTGHWIPIQHQKKTKEGPAAVLGLYGTGIMKTSTNTYRTVGCSDTPSWGWLSTVTTCSNAHAQTKYSQNEAHEKQFRLVKVNDQEAIHLS